MANNILTPWRKTLGAIIITAGLLGQFLMQFFNVKQTEWIMKELPSAQQMKIVNYIHMEKSPKQVKEAAEKFLTLKVTLENVQNFIEKGDLKKALDSVVNANGLIYDLEKSGFSLKDERATLKELRIALQQALGKLPV